MRIRRTEAAAFLLAAFMLAVGAAQPARAEEAPPRVSAEAAVLADLDSGTVIYALNENRRMLIASTTKIMTALVALERCGLGDEVEIKREWTLTEGSSMHLRAGERRTVEELLYGLLLVSGNDAARALACHCAGGEEAFAALMNAKASELGMADTRFANPHGLDQEGHYSTASDMAKLARAAMKNPELARIAATREAVVGGAVLKNHNRLLWSCQGALGLKTGYTKAAGRALVSCAKRGGTSLVCVTLNDPDDWDDHAALYGWGFSAYKTVPAGELSFTVPIITGEAASAEARCAPDASFFVKNDGSLKIEAELPRFEYAPVYEGQTAGRLRVISGGKTAGEVPLRYAATVRLDEKAPLSFWEKLRWAWYFANRHSVYSVYPPY